MRQAEARQSPDEPPARVELEASEATACAGGIAVMVVMPELWPKELTATVECHPKNLDTQNPQTNN